MDIVIPEATILHHSTADWKFYPKPYSYSATWLLDTSLPVSPPSSLRIDLPSTAAYTPLALMVLNIPAAQNLLQGRIVTYHRMSAIALPRKIGVCYAVKELASAWTAVDFPRTTAWAKTRFTWWNSFDLQNLPKLATRIDTWDGVKWVEGAIVYVNRLTGDENRAGVYATTGFNTALQDHYDDTEIWKTD